MIGIVYYFYLNTHYLLVPLQEFFTEEDQLHACTFVLQIICMLGGIFPLLILWLRIINSHLKVQKCRVVSKVAEMENLGLLSWLIWYIWNICPIVRIMASALPWTLLIHSLALCFLAETVVSFLLQFPSEFPVLHHLNLFSSFVFYFNLSFLFPTPSSLHFSNRSDSCNTDENLKFPWLLKRHTEVNLLILLFSTGEFVV